jgi:hypothetical protein
MESDLHTTICIMNKGLMYGIFVTIPLVLSICINLYINLKYGHDEYLKKFSKNYEQFKLIFSVQRMYFITWTVTMIPSILFSLFTKEHLMPYYTITLALQPMCIIVTVALSWRMNKNLKDERMKKAGIVQKLREAAQDEDDIGMPYIVSSFRIQRNH